jgi:hypothetical protein
MSQAQWLNPEVLVLEIAFQYYRREAGGTAGASNKVNVVVDVPQTTYDSATHGSEDAAIGFHNWLADTYGLYSPERVRVAIMGTKGLRLVFVNVTHDLSSITGRDWRKPASVQSTRRRRRVVRPS